MRFTSKAGTALAIWAMLSLPGAAFAQDLLFRTPLAPSQRSTFEAACSGFAGVEVLRGEFSQTKTLKRLDRTLESSGAFVISRSRGIIWETRKPFASTMIVGASSITQISASGERSVLGAEGNAAFAQFSDTMRAVLSGDAGKLYAGFDVYFQGGPASWRIGLIPRDSTVRAMVASMTIEGGADLAAFSIGEANGDSVRYRFANLVRSESLLPADAARFGR